MKMQRGLGILTIVLGSAAAATTPCYRLASNCVPPPGGGLCDAGTIVCQTGYTSNGASGQAGNQPPLAPVGTTGCVTYTAYFSFPCVYVAEDGPPPGTYTGCGFKDDEGNPTGVCCYGYGIPTSVPPPPGQSSGSIMYGPTGPACTNP